MTDSNIYIVQARPTRSEAMRFNGKNSKEIAAWVRENGESATARGSYIKIVTDEGFYKVLNGDWVIQRRDGGFEVLTDETFRQRYTLPNVKQNLVLVS